MFPVVPDPEKESKQPDPALEPKPDTGPEFGCDLVSVHVGPDPPTVAVGPFRKVVRATMKPRYDQIFTDPTARDPDLDHLQPPPFTRFDVE